jgi:hypothetical protein
VILGIGVVAALVVARWIHSEQERGLNRFLVVLGSLVAFSAGVNQVGLVVGPLVSLLADVDVPLLTVPAGGGLGILVGFWIGAPRMIMTLSQDYASLGPRRSTSALLPTFPVRPGSRRPGDAYLVRPGRRHRDPRQRCRGRRRRRGGCRQVGPYRQRVGWIVRAGVRTRVGFLTIF